MSYVLFLRGKKLVKLADFVFHERREGARFRGRHPARRETAD
jgi:hypothetical protein